MASHPFRGVTFTPMTGEQETVAHKAIGEGATVDRTALETLIKEHYPGLRLLVLKKVRDPHVAADILDGAITKSWEHLKANRVGDPDKFAGWVYRVALNDLRNYRRNMNTRGDVRGGTEALEALPGGGDASDEVAETKLAALVRAVIERLPTERDRTIIKRFYLDEASKEEICREHGNLSPLHFDRVIHRARQRMKELLQKHGFKRGDFFSLLCAA
jgi:RNA polymerase sigma-70 factor, ECF subfamily